MRKEYWSNCLLEAIKAKLKDWKNIDIIYISAKKNDVNCPHWMWLNKKTGEVEDFHCDSYLEHWWNFFWWKGWIRSMSRESFERWWVSRQ